MTNPMYGSSPYPSKAAVRRALRQGAIGAPFSMLGQRKMRLPLPDNPEEAERVIRDVYDEGLWKYWSRYFPDGDEPNTLMLPDKTCIPRESGDWRVLFLAMDRRPPYQQLKCLGTFVSASRALNALLRAALEWGFVLRPRRIEERIRRMLKRHAFVTLWLARTSTQYPYCSVDIMDTVPIGGHGARRAGRATVGWGITVLAKGGGKR